MNLYIIKSKKSQTNIYFTKKKKENQLKNCVTMVTTRTNSVVSCNQTNVPTNTTFSLWSTVIIMFLIVSCFSNLFMRSLFIFRILNSIRLSTFYTLWFVASTILFQQISDIFVAFLRLGQVVWYLFCQKLGFSVSRGPPEHAICVEE